MLKEVSHVPFSSSRDCFLEELLEEALSSDSSSSGSPSKLVPETSCCRICFLSSALDRCRVGVELLRFFRGEGVPSR